MSASFRKPIRDGDILLVALRWEEWSRRSLRVCYAAHIGGPWPSKGKNHVRCSRQTTTERCVQKIQASSSPSLPDSSAQTERTSSGGVQSLDLALRVLAELARGAGAMNLKDIAHACDMPPSKVHRYLSSFLSTSNFNNRR